MDIKLLVAVAFTGAALSGCATMIKGTQQDVAVNTIPEEGADCVLQNTRGTWHLTTPGKAHVHKDMHSLIITCNKSGYQEATEAEHPKFQGWTLAGGAVGLGVDASDGAMAEYKPAYTIQMIPNNSSPSTKAVPTPSSPEPAARPSS